MREQFYIVPYNHFIKKLISATFHYPKVMNSFDVFDIMGFTVFPISLKPNVLVDLS